MGEHYSVQQLMYCTEQAMLKHVMLSVMTSKSVGGMVVPNKQKGSGVILYGCLGFFSVAFVFSHCILQSI